MLILIIIRIRSGQNKIRENAAITISNKRFNLVLESFKIYKIKRRKISNI